MASVSSERASCGVVDMASVAIRSWIRGSLIGAGAFGKVNLALNREDGEVFAVKSVQVDGNDTGCKGSLKALENEIEILQSLDSKYVVRCLGSDWTEESGKATRNLFLEYMPEGCLTDFLKQFAGAESIHEHLIRTYTRSIVEGIDYLHSNGIVHCDIKGKNILVGNGNVKLTDFGSAKRVGDDEVVNCSAKMNGTPLWMAPEVAREVEQGPASDIWSLGCTVLEMATGKAPWSDIVNPYVALYHIGCTDEIPAVPASLSPEAHDFLAQCLQRDPRKRWTSAQLLQHPFLTTRSAAVAPKLVPSPMAPLSPTSVMQFPSIDSSSGMSSTFDNSVPILSTPSFFRRGLVCAQPSKRSSPRAQEQEENNWWGSSPNSPPAGQWIVVRSPKAAPASSSSSPFSDLMPPAVKNLVVTVKAPIVSQESGDIVSSGVATVASVNKISTRSFTLEQCSHPVTSSVTPTHNAASGDCTKVIGVVAHSEILNHQGAADVDVRSSKNDLSDVFVLAEEQNLSGESGCLLSRPCPTSVMEDGAPRTNDGLRFLDQIPKILGDSQLESCHLVPKQEILFLWQCLLWAERRYSVQFIRNHLRWSSPDYVHWKLGPWDHCPTLSRNESSPLVKLRINFLVGCV